MFYNQQFRQQRDTGHGAEAQVWVSLDVLHVTSLDTKRLRRDSEKGPGVGGGLQWQMIEGFGFRIVSTYPSYKVVFQHHKWHCHARCEIKHLHS